MKPCQIAEGLKHCPHLEDRHCLPDRYRCGLARVFEWCDADEPCMEGDMRYCHNWMRHNGIPIVVCL